MKKINLTDLLPRIQGQKIVPIKVPLSDSGAGYSAPIMVFTSYCSNCSNYGPEGACKAFPDGIPATIALGVFDHRKRFVGDEGVTYDGPQGPIDAQVENLTRERIEFNLETLEASRSIMPDEFPSILGQVRRYDNLDWNRQEDEMAKVSAQTMSEYEKHLSSEV